MENDDSSLIKHALEDAPFAVVILDYQGRLVWANDAAESLAGLAMNELIGRSRMTLPAEFEWLFVPEKRFLLPATAARRPRWLKAVSRTLHLPQMIARVHYYIDVSAEEQLRLECNRIGDELQEVSLRDPVTGLPNRRALLHLLESLVAHSRRYHNALSIIRFGIGNFDRLAQRLGRAGADQIVVNLAQRLREHIRWADHLSRIEDHELLLVLPETDECAARTLAAKLSKHIDAIETQAANEQQRDAAELQVGIAAWAIGDDAHQLVNKTQQALPAGPVEALGRTGSDR